MLAAADTRQGARGLSYALVDTKFYLQRVDLRVRDEWLGNGIEFAVMCGRGREGRGELSLRCI